MPLVRKAVSFLFDKNANKNSNKTSMHKSIYAISFTNFGINTSERANL